MVGTTGPQPWEAREIFTFAGGSLASVRSWGLKFQSFTARLPRSVWETYHATRLSAHRPPISLPTPPILPRLHTTRPVLPFPTGNWITWTMILHSMGCSLIVPLPVRFQVPHSGMVGIFL